MLPLRYPENNFLYYLMLPLLGECRDEVNNLSSRSCVHRTRSLEQ